MNTKWGLLLIVIILTACAPSTPETRNQEILLDAPTNTLLSPTDILFTATLIPTMTLKPTLKPTNTFTLIPTGPKLYPTVTPKNLPATLKPIVKTPTKSLSKPTATSKASSKPTATSKPARKPTATSKPATGPCVCSRDYDCDDFSTQKGAQTCFNYCGGSKTKNWSNLDADHDGLACESLP